MHSSYYKKLNTNYLILQEDSSDNTSTGIFTDYRVKMIQENTIYGLLSLEYKYINGMPACYADVTDYQPLSVIMDNSQFSYDSLRTFIYELYKTLYALEEYLLSIDELLLSPDYIYVSQNLNTFKFVYYPVVTSDHNSNLKALFEYILEHIDHNCSQSVYLSYTLYRLTTKKDFTLNGLLSVLGNSLTKSANIDHESITDQSIPHDFINKSNMTNSDTIECNINKFDISLQDINEHNMMGQNMSGNIMAPDENSETNFLSSPVINNGLLRFSKAFCVKLSVFTICCIAALTGILCSYFYINYSLELLLILFSIYIFFAVYGILYFRRISHSCHNLSFSDSNAQSHHDLSNTDSLSNTEEFSPDILSSGKTFSPELSVSSMNSSFVEPISSDSDLCCKTVILNNPDSFPVHSLTYLGTDSCPEFSLTHFPFTIGKLKNSDGILNNSLISRLHARFDIENNDNDYVYVEDLNSSNGTFVNNILLTPYEKQKLSPGDKVSFAHLTYIYR